MDEGVYLNMKYAIICRKTMLILENEEEMCFIAKENFVQKIAVHRLLFKHPFVVNTASVVT